VADIDLSTKEKRDAIRRDIYMFPGDEYADTSIIILAALDLLDEQAQTINKLAEGMDRYAALLKPQLPPAWLDAPDGPGDYWAFDGAEVFPVHITKDRKAELYVWNWGSEVEFGVDGLPWKWFGPLTPPAPPEES
jgi:hypothetical protein